MRTFDELCIPDKSTEKKKMTLKQAWQEKEKLWEEGHKLCAEGNKFYAEGNKLYVEGDKLYAEGRKLWAEGDKLYAKGRLTWINAWAAEFGKDSTVDWDWGEKNA
ncbi:MAG: hypothetical protein UV51_C0018G0011 [Candidatus Woesebacteria bacterium GW2011_GWC1_42_9]|nr:MAG: hypothetical protein UV51_C0018G0011 [Candidatus Woesebacteria bacterium GW2011_GWC1_42_9]